MLNKFGENFFPCEQVGHGEVLDSYDVFRDNEVSPKRFIERDGWNSEAGAFHRDRAGGCDADIRLAESFCQPAALNFYAVGNAKLFCLLDQVVTRQHHPRVQARDDSANNGPGIQHDRDVPGQFAWAAAGEKKKSLRRGRSSGWTVGLAIAIQNRVSNKNDRESRNAFRVPIFLEWKNAEDQIIVLGDLKRPAFARGPHLRRNILNNQWLPSVKPAGSLTDELPDGVGKAPVETTEVHADNHVRLAVQR